MRTVEKSAENADKNFRWQVLQVLDATKLDGYIRCPLSLGRSGPWRIQRTFWCDHFSGEL